MTKLSMKSAPVTTEGSFAGVAAGPAEELDGGTVSGAYLAEAGEPFTVTARVAGLLPAHTDDAPGIVRQCLRTVDHGLALCWPVTPSEMMRIGAVVEADGIVTGQRTQGEHLVTEIKVNNIRQIG